MAALNRKILIRHLPVGAAVVVAIVAAIVFAFMPVAVLEQMVWRTGVAALVPAAQPPLGMTARSVLALATAGIGAAVTWSALFLLVGPGGLLVGAQRRADGMPVIRRADAHPDAPPRRPMSAADLGTPLMEVHAANTVQAERPIPADLDQPLAAFDPHALLPVPMEPARPVAPLVAKAAEPDVEAPVVVVEAKLPPVERLEVFSLPRIAVQPVQPVPPPTIEALLRRLEQGASRRRQVASG